MRLQHRAHALVRLAQSMLRRLRGRRGATLEFWMLDLEAVTPTESARDVQFREVPVERLLRERDRYGLGLDSAERDPCTYGQCWEGLAPDGELVFYMWARPLSVAECSEANPLLEAGPVTFVHNCATVPAHRGRGIYPSALRWLAARRREAGDRWLLLTTAARATAAQRAVAKAGFVPFESFRGSPSKHGI